MYRVASNYWGQLRCRGVASVAGWCTELQGGPICPHSFVTWMKMFHLSNRIPDGVAGVWWLHARLGSHHRCLHIMGKRCTTKVMKETRKGINVFEGESKMRGTAQKHRKHTMAGLACLKAPKVGAVPTSWFLVWYFNFKQIPWPLESIVPIFSDYVICEP